MKSARVCALISPSGEKAARKDLMKIASIEIFQHGLKVVNGPYIYSGGTLDSLTTYLVKIKSDGGLTGWGETCPLGPTYQPAHAAGALAALHELAPNLIGEPVLPRPLMHKMDSLLAEHNYAKAAIDIAVYDLLGKALQQPVHALLGGALREKVPSYYAISLLSPEESVRIVKEKQKEGYRALQIKSGSGDVRKDAEVIRSIYEVLAPGVTMAVDANRAMTTAEVIQFSNLVRDVPLALEQPCNTIEETRSLMGRVNHPIYLDESAVDVVTVMTELGRGTCDGLGMKLTRVGGLSSMITVRDMAAARNAPMSVDDSWGGDVIAAACVHMASTVAPRLFRGTWLAAPYIEQHYDPVNGIRIVDGEIQVPQAHGLGVTPDESLFGSPVAKFE